MKRVLFTLSVLSLFLMSCAENTTSNCNSNMVSYCNATGTALIVCDQGVLREQACDGGCNISNNQCMGSTPTQTECVDSTYTRQCNANLNGYTWCEGGSIKTQMCDAGKTCNPTLVACELQAQTGCTDSTVPPSCNGSTLTFCSAETVYTVTCGQGTTCDASTKTCKINDTPVQPPATDTCDAQTFQEECVTPHKLKTCLNGKITTLTCSAGQMCNQAIKNKSCKIPNVGDACDPNAFAESCYGNTEAIYCDEETLQVTRIDCVDLYGKGYKCDIAENYAGPDLDVTTCYSNAENCKIAGDIKTECTFEDQDDGYRQFYTITYECGEFNTGLHYYLASEEDCEFKCNSSKTACSD